MKGVMQKVQRFGGAMFTPVLLFSFAGIMVGLSTLFMNQSIFGALAAEEGIWYKIWYMIQEGAWMVMGWIMKSADKKYMTYCTGTPRACPTV